MIKKVTTHLSGVPLVRTITPSELKTEILYTCKLAGCYTDITGVLVFKDGKAHFFVCHTDTDKVKNLHLYPLTRFRDFVRCEKGIELTIIQQ